MHTQIIPAFRRQGFSAGALDARRLNVAAGGSPVAKDVLQTTWRELAGRAPHGPVPITWEQDAGLAAEGYRLSIRRRGVAIAFAQPAGAFYGFVALAQLAAANDGRLPIGTVDDCPAMSMRGVTDDLSRGQIPGAKTFQANVRRLAYLRCNHYFLYMEDVFRSRSQSELGKYSDPIPLRELRQLAAYGRKWFVSVRPIFNMLGHWDKAAPLKRYASLMLPLPERSKFPFRQVLDPRNPKVRPMLRRLVKELVACFGPGLFHAGGDEPLHLTELLGKDEAARLYVDHYRWVHQELAALGCRMAMYSDVFTPVWGDFAVGVQAARQIPADTLMVYWNYKPTADMSAMTELMDLGFEVVVSPTTGALGHMYPCVPLPHANSAALLRQAGDRAVGLLMSTWHDGGGDNLGELEWFGYAVAAEAAWAGNMNRPYAGLLDDFYRQFYGLRGNCARALRPLHEHDGLFATDHRREVWQQFWRDAREPFDAKFLKVARHAGQIRKAAAWLRRQRPRRNLPAWRCLLFSADRLLLAVEKTLAIPPGPFATREQAIALAPAYDRLAARVKALAQRHRQLWMATNRYSEWDFIAAKYADLEESLRSLARYARVFIRFREQKRMLT